MTRGLPTTVAALAGAVLCIASPPTFAQGNCGQWQSSNLQPIPDGMREVESAAGGFIVVGDSGHIATSPDGAAWTSQDSGEVQDLTAVTWNGTLYVAVGGMGTILTSPDGITWTRRPSGTTFGLQGVRWVGTQFVAVGNVGTILTSPDGSEWTVRVSGTGVALTDVAGGGGMLVAVGNVGWAATSPDGVTWTPRYLGTTEELTSIAWSGSRFVVTALNICQPNCMSSAFLRSDDGIHWTRQAQPDLPYDVAWTGTEFVASGSGRIFRSPDGTSWSSSPLSTFGFSIAWSGDRLAVLDGITIQSSTDGVTWTVRALDSRYSLWSLAWNGQRFVVTAGNFLILSSADGVDWTQHRTDTNKNLFTVAWGNGRFVALGAFGSVTTSPDGMNWTAQASLAHEIDLLDVIWNGTRFVGAGSRRVGAPPYPGVIITSANGVSWTVHHEPREILSVVRNGALHVAVGAGGVVLTSPDAVTWTPRPSGTDQALHSVTWTGSQFVAVGAGVVLTSPDGIAWTERDAPTSEQILDVASNGSLAFDASLLVAVTDSGRVFTSPDAITWTEEGFRSSGPLHDVDWIRGRFWAVGDAATIARRDCPRFVDVPPAFALPLP